MKQKAKEWCRRGESEFGPPLIPRNLLILQDGRNYKNIGFAQVRYTAGYTEILAKGPLVSIFFLPESAADLRKSLG
jgi:hypothetical protein